MNRRDFLKALMAIGATDLVHRLETDSPRLFGTALLDNANVDLWSHHFVSTEPGDAQEWHDAAVGLLRIGELWHPQKSYALALLTATEPEMVELVARGYEHGGKLLTGIATVYENRLLEFRAKAVTWWNMGAVEFSYHVVYERDCDGGMAFPLFMGRYDPPVVVSEDGNCTIAWKDGAVARIRI